MSEVNHTPGPWTWCGKEGQPDMGYDVSEAGTGRKVCEIGSNSGRWASEAYANARLIAAAPELLTESIEVMNAVDGPAGSMRRFRDGQKRLLAAIAKATGNPVPRVGYIASELEQARGRLQDAAPDLLAACEECLLVLQVNRLDNWVGAKMLRAAIAKAKGINP